MNEKLWKYLRFRKKEVTGWLQRVDAEIIGSILQFQCEQNIVGSLLEIGVHHGKSFIPLCMALRDDELALCIDIFDDQSRNLDSSGEGNFDSFQKNLSKFDISPLNVRIFKGSSEDVNCEYILGQVGSVRFFSVDGGHWKSIVQNDLLLAEQSLSAGGVIALDDYCRAEWPDVTVGYALWQDKTKSDIIPFAIGSNKLFLCRRDYANAYRKALNNSILHNFLGKTYRAESFEIDSYRVELVEQDETRMVKVVSLMLKIFRPNLFLALKDRLHWSWN